MRAKQAEGLPSAVPPEGGTEGLTLLELFVVLVILGVLVTMAAPHFGRAMERGRVKNAQTVLVSIYNAERMYRLDEDTYGPLRDPNPNDDTPVGLIANRYLSDPDAGVDPADNDPPGSNPDWNFTTSNVAATTFTATATRTGGGFNGNTISLNENFDGNNYNCDGYPPSLCP